MRKIFLVAISCSIYNLHTEAQQLSPTIISAAGGTDSISHLQLEWTLGENAVETGSNSTAKYTQGFHQPILVLSKKSHVVKSSKTGNETEIKINIAPNPVQSMLHVRILSGKNQELKLSIIDMYGKEVQSKMINQPTTVDFNLNQQSAGIYLLTIGYENGNILSTYKIVKTN